MELAHPSLLLNTLAGQTGQGRREWGGQEWGKEANSMSTKREWEQVGKSTLLTWPCCFSLFYSQEFARLRFNQLQANYETLKRH